MNKAELLDLVSEKAEVSKKDADTIVGSVARSYRRQTNPLLAS